MEPNFSPPVQQALMRHWEPLYRSQLHFLVTWSTRGRRPVLKDRHTQALQALIRTVCEERGFGLVEVVSGHVHVHVLLGLKPAQSVASAVRELLDQIEAFRRRKERSGRDDSPVVVRHAQQQLVL